MRPTPAGLEEASDRETRLAFIIFAGAGHWTVPGTPARGRMRMTTAENVRVVLKLAANVGGDR